MFSIYTRFTTYIFKSYYAYIFHHLIGIPQSWQCLCCRRRLRRRSLSDASTLTSKAQANALWPSRWDNGGIQYLP
jgi:hypothetical protein